VHYLNLFHHPGLGVVFLDPQQGTLARLPAKPAHLDLWVTTRTDLDLAAPVPLPATGSSGYAGSAPGPPQRQPREKGFKHFAPPERVHRQLGCPPLTSSGTSRPLSWKIRPTR
jgi:hypothetical protein